MNNLKSKNQFEGINESKLTDEEKAYLWKKLEFKKKKKATEDKEKSDLYNYLKGDKKTLKDDEFLKVLNSLEYGFRKRLKDVDNPMKSDVFVSIQKKLPATWSSIKYSGLKPNKSNSTAEIKTYLKSKKIKFDDDAKKSVLVKLIG